MRTAQRGSGRLGIFPCRKTANEVSVRNRGFLKRSEARYSTVLGEASSEIPSLPAPAINTLLFYNLEIAKNFS